MAKSFVSAPLGIAIDDGLIKSIDDSVLTYIPEFKDIDLSDKLTIRHLLNHTSGFKSSVILDINLYYGQNIMEQLKNMSQTDFSGVLGEGHWKSPFTQIFFKKGRNTPPLITRHFLNLRGGGY